MNMLRLALLGALVGTAMAAARGEGDVIYQDDTANTSANVKQVFPGVTGPGATSITVLTHVQKIELMHGEIFAITWTGGAMTFLPKQFVADITINRRAATTEPAR